MQPVCQAAACDVLPCRQLHAHMSHQQVYKRRTSCLHACMHVSRCTGLHRAMHCTTAQHSVTCKRTALCTFRWSCILDQQGAQSPLHTTLQQTGCPDLHILYRLQKLCLPTTELSDSPAPKKQAAEMNPCNVHVHNQMPKDMRCRCYV